MRNDPSEGNPSTSLKPGVLHEPTPMGRPMQQPTYEPFTPHLPLKPKKILAALCLVAVLLAGFGLVKGLAGLSSAKARPDSSLATPPKAHAPAPKTPAPPSNPTSPAR